VGATAWSVGHATSIGHLLEAQPELLVIGNISTNLIDNGPLSRIESGVARAKEAGAVAIAPACGLAMGTPLQNIRAFTEAVRKSPAIPANPGSLARGLE
jgi:[methyl-Co(III) methanol-specific corrinoid protein]:coenzyme M methyltransferase